MLTFDGHRCIITDSDGDRVEFEKQTNGKILVTSKDLDMDLEWVYTFIEPIEVVDLVTFLTSGS